MISVHLVKELNPQKSINLLLGDVLQLSVGNESHDGCELQSQSLIVLYYWRYHQKQTCLGNTDFLQLIYFLQVISSVVLNELKCILRTTWKNCIELTVMPEGILHRFIPAEASMIFFMLLVFKFQLQAVWWQGKIGLCFESQTYFFFTYWYIFINFTYSNDNSKIWLK